MNLLSANCIYSFLLRILAEIICFSFSRRFDSLNFIADFNFFGPVFQQLQKKTPKQVLSTDVSPDRVSDIFKEVFI